MPENTRRIEDSIDRSKLIERFCNGRDVFCTKCGHNLRNLKVRRCPECGREIELMAIASGAPLPHLLAWPLILRGIALGGVTGVSGVIASQLGIEAGSSMLATLVLVSGLILASLVVVEIRLVLRAVSTWKPTAQTKFTWHARAPFRFEGTWFGATIGERGSAIGSALIDILSALVFLVWFCGALLVLLSWF